MTPDDFEARYQRRPDPWDYERSDYEHAKYAATLAACGAGPFASALELGGSIGVFTELLAPRCHGADHGRRRADGGRRWRVDGSPSFPQVRVDPRRDPGRDPGSAATT